MLWYLIKHRDNFTLLYYNWSSVMCDIITKYILLRKNGPLTNHFYSCQLLTQGCSNHRASGRIPRCLCCSLFLNYSIWFLHVHVQSACCVFKTSSSSWALRKGCVPLPPGTRLTTSILTYLFKFVTVHDPSVHHRYVGHCLLSEVYLI
jgi:hypothetical protein